MTGRYWSMLCCNRCYSVQPWSDQSSNKRTCASDTTLHTHPTNMHSSTMHRLQHNSSSNNSMLWHPQHNSLCSNSNSMRMHKQPVSRAVVARSGGNGAENGRLTSEKQREIAKILLQTQKNMLELNNSRVKVQEELAVAHRRIADLGACVETGSVWLEGGRVRGFAPNIP